MVNLQFLKPWVAIGLWTSYSSNPSRPFDLNQGKLASNSAAWPGHCMALAVWLLTK